MRIFVVGANYGPDSMEKHVLAALTGMGHIVQAYNARDIIAGAFPGVRIINALAGRFLREPERLQEKTICHAVDIFQPDLVLTLLGSMLSPKTIAKMRHVTRAKIVCWCQDQMTTLGRQYLLGAEYDHVFVKDHYLVDLFKAMLGIDVHYLPEACNPKVHRAMPVGEAEQREYGCDICTYGNLYYYRQTIMQSLAAYDVKIWGNVPDWLINRVPGMVMNRGIYEIEKAKALSAARITLNTLHFGEINGLNARAFETAGCGAFQLMSASPAIGEHFEIGKEVETFSDRHELLSKVEHYLQRPEEVARFRVAAETRAHRDHTYELRLGELLNRSR
jgi:spore maturation protein CgeB